MTIGRYPRVTSLRAVGARLTTTSDAEFGELGDNVLARRTRTHVLIDVGDPAVGADIERPPRCKWLIAINHAVCGSGGLRGVTQDRIIHAERLRKLLIGLGSVHTDREVGDLEVPDLIPTRTE